MIREIDLSILSKMPDLKIRAELIIEPLAPLSMVDDFPGSFYKTLRIPSKKLLCGLMENIIGWHIDWADRKKIIEDLKKNRKKHHIDFVNYQNKSTYIPLLMDYFKIIDEVKIEEYSNICFFDDLWSRSYRRADAVVHPKGTENIDYRLIGPKWELKRDDKNQEKIDSKVLEQFFKENIGNFPMYYTTPTSREYIDLKGKYSVPLLMDETLYYILKDEIEANNIGYLGNSEGWINLKLVKL